MKSAQSTENITEENKFQLSVYEAIFAKTRAPLARVHELAEQSKRRNLLTVLASVLTIIPINFKLDSQSSLITCEKYRDIFGAYHIGMKQWHNTGSGDVMYFRIFNFEQSPVGDFLYVDRHAWDILKGRNVVKDSKHSRMEVSVREAALVALKFIDQKIAEKSKSWFSEAWNLIDSISPCDSLAHHEMKLCQYLNCVKLHSLKESIEKTNQRFDLTFGISNLLRRYASYGWSDEHTSDITSQLQERMKNLLLPKSPFHHDMFVVFQYRTDPIVQSIMSELRHTGESLGGDLNVTEQIRYLALTQYCDEGLIAEFGRKQSLKNASPDKKVVILLRNSLQFGRGKQADNAHNIQLSASYGIESTLLDNYAYVWFQDADPFDYMHFLEQFVCRAVCCKTSFNKLVMPKHMLAEHIVGVKHLASWYDIPAPRYELHLILKNLTDFFDDKNGFYLENWFSHHRIVETDKLLLTHRMCVLIFIVCSNYVPGSDVAHSLANALCAMSALKITGISPSFSSFYNVNTNTKFQDLGVTQLLLMKQNPILLMEGNVRCQVSPPGYARNLPKHIVRDGDKLELMSLFDPKVKTKKTETKVPTITREAVPEIEPTPETLADKVELEDVEFDDEELQLITLPMRVGIKMILLMHRAKTVVKLRNTVLTPSERLFAETDIFWRTPAGQKFSTEARAFYLNNLVPSKVELSKTLSDLTRAIDCKRIKLTVDDGCKKVEILDMAMDLKEELVELAQNMKLSEIAGTDLINTLADLKSQAKKLEAVTKTFQFSKSL